MRFIQDRKKNVGPIKYNKSIMISANIGNRSNKKLKNKNSDTKKMDPGNPRNISVLSNIIRNNFGHKKLIPLTSVIKRVLNLRATASTSKNELVDKSA
jgi:hypothetical protein